MAVGLHSLAHDHLPAFITAPDETDTPMALTAAVLLAAMADATVIITQRSLRPWFRKSRRNDVFCDVLVMVKTAP